MTVTPLKKIRNKKPLLSHEAITLYNTLLTLSWCESLITINDIEEKTGTNRHELGRVLKELIEANKVLAGPEEVMGHLDVYTYTPLVKGVGYGYPLDYFDSYYEYMENAL